MADHQAENRFRACQYELDGTGSPPTVDSDKALVPPLPIQLLEASVDDHAAIQGLRTGLVADAGQVEGGNLGPGFKPWPDRRPFELGELGHQ
jgi:hypothetical protein